MKNWQFRFHLHQEPENIKAIGTRMDSSRMRTARLLTVSVVFHWVCLPGGVSAHGGRGYLPRRGGVCPGEGVSAQGRECLPRGGSVCPRGCLPRGCLPRPLYSGIHTPCPLNAGIQTQCTLPVHRRNDTRL